MSKVPSLNYDKVVKALQRDGWILVRQKGSHIKMQKEEDGKKRKLIIPAHKPIKRSTLSHILKQARLSLDTFFHKLSLFLF